MEIDQHGYASAPHHVEQELLAQHANWCDAPVQRPSVLPAADAIVASSSNDAVNADSDALDDGNEADDAQTDTAPAVSPKRRGRRPHAAQDSAATK